MVTSMDLPPIVGHNPTIAYHLILASLTSGPKNTQSQGSYVFLDALKALPPTLPSFDLLGRLLQNTCIVVDAATGGKTTIADVIRAEVLGHFINENIKWIDAAEGEERDGQVSDDRFAKGVQNVSEHRLLHCSLFVPLLSIFTHVTWFLNVLVAFYA